MSDLTAGKIRRIKSKLCDKRPTIWIGKDGASEELMKEIAKQLDREEMVKVRILKSALAEGEAKQIASKVAGQTSASLVEVRGHTFMLYKSRGK
jgi:RNA-binding protein